MRKVALSALFLLLAGCGREALACSCIPVDGDSWTPKKRLGRVEYETVFLGSVTKIEDDSKGEADREPKVKVTFAVERFWADARPGADKYGPEIVVRTNKHDGLCGYKFKTGGRYFVFATYGETHLCTPTDRYDEDDAPDYFKFLGEGRAPSKSDDPARGRPPEGGPPGRRR